MNAVTVSAGGMGDAEMKLKRRLTEVQEVPNSDLPYRLKKRSTGVTLGAFEHASDVTEFLSRYSLTLLQVKPTRRRSRS